MSEPPLAYEASDESDPFISSTLPQEVVTCLKNARFLHLATCEGDTPHLSLMNYTYLPSTPFSSMPTIVMTTHPLSKKTANLVRNPKVSLLVHDWVSHRPPTAVAQGREGSPPPQAQRSSLATMLLQMNTSALSRISVTINGAARMVEQGSEEEKWCRDMHLENNTFDQNTSSQDLFGTSPSDMAGDGGRGCFIEGQEVRVVVVQVKDGRIADWRGKVSDWQISQDHDENGAPLVNGTR